MTLTHSEADDPRRKRFGDTEAYEECRIDRYKKRTTSPNPPDDTDTINLGNGPIKML